MPHVKAFQQCCSVAQVGFLALLLLPAASDLPLVGARVMTVLVAHLVTCRQVDLRAAATPSGLRTMMRRHAGTAAQTLMCLPWRV